MGEEEKEEKVTEEKQEEKVTEEKQEEKVTEEKQEEINPAKFVQLADAENVKKDNFNFNSPVFKENIKLLLDVSMEITVELGRSRRTVEEVLTLGEGSIIELDKLAGEAIDLFVNGKIIAKGEVVVIDENFGIRVTKIVSQEQRLLDTELL